METDARVRRDVDSPDLSVKRQHGRMKGSWEAKKASKRRLEQEVKGGMATGVDTTPVDAKAPPPSLEEKKKLRAVGQGDRPKSSTQLSKEVAQLPVETYAYFQVSACGRFRVHHQDLRRTARTWLSHVHNPSMSESRQDPGSSIQDPLDVQHFLIQSRRMSSVTCQGHKSGSARLSRTRSLLAAASLSLCVSLVMTTSVPLDVGKYALLGVGSSAYSTQIGEVVIVIEHKVNAGSSTGNLTTVAVVQDMATANVIAVDAHVSGDATVAPALLRAAEAR